MKSTAIFASKGHGVHTFATVPEKKSIMCHYLVYYIIQTCNTNDNRDTAISLSEIYDILINVREI